MSPVLYAINIGTLATWLSVATFGTIGIIVPVIGEDFTSKEKSTERTHVLESLVMTEIFATSELPPAQETDTGSTGDANETDVPHSDQETLPTPPALPETAEITPLPEIPDLPPPSKQPAETAAPPPQQTTPKTASKTPTRSKLPTSATGGSPQGKTEAKGKTGNGGRDGGSGMSDAKRLAGGYMPRPSYPAEARAKNQTGTVVVQFTIDENGKVISARAISPSRWPVLNECAVAITRRWKFPPGGVSTHTKPFTFQLK